MPAGLRHTIQRNAVTKVLKTLWTCSLKKASSVTFQILLKIDIVDKIRYIAVQFIKIVGQLRNLISKRLVLLNFYYFR